MTFRQGLGFSLFWSKDPMLRDRTIPSTWFSFFLGCVGGLFSPSATNSVASGRSVLPSTFLCIDYISIFYIRYFSVLLVLFSFVFIYCSSFIYSYFYFIMYSHFIYMCCLFLFYSFIKNVILIIVTEFINLTFALLF